MAATVQAPITLTDRQRTPATIPTAGPVVAFQLSNGMPESVVLVEIAPGLVDQLQPGESALYLPSSYAAYSGLIFLSATSGGMLPPNSSGQLSLTTYTTTAPDPASVGARPGQPYPSFATLHDTLSPMRSMLCYYVDDFGAIGDGVTDDTTAILAALSAASGAQGTVILSGRQYLISAPLTVEADGITIRGMGKASQLIIGSAFTGAAAILTTGTPSVHRLTVQDLRIAGQSGTYSSNPACDAIQLNSDVEDTVLENVHFAAINGWAMQLLAGASGFIGYTNLTNCVAKQCKAGYRAASTVPASNRSGGLLISNCVADNCQAGDAYDFEEVTDNVMSNCQGYSQTGSSLHIKGCAFLFVTNCDLGGASPSAPCILIEKGAAHSNDHLRLDCTFAQKGTVGIDMTGVAHLRIKACDVYFNQGHGIQIHDDASNGSMIIEGCQFDQNNQSNAATQYDLNNLGSHGNLILRGNHFQTAVGSGAGKVAASLASPTFWQGLDVQANVFSGGSPVTSPALINKTLFRANAGYNPVGALSAPGVPASLTAQQNDRTVDCTVYVTCGAGVTVSAIAVGGTTITGVSVAASSTSGPVRVPALSTITLTYAGGTPTWQWYGD